MTTPQTDSIYNPRTLAVLIDHYEKTLQNPLLPFEVRIQFMATLCHYTAMYNMQRADKQVSISSRLNLAA